jgi:hypothetical protein
LAKPEARTIGEYEDDVGAWYAKRPVKNIKEVSKEELCMTHENGRWYGDTQEKLRVPFGSPCQDNLFQRAEKWVT